MNEETLNTSTNTHPGLKEVSDKVLRYFREFLESDFKRQQAPRRRIQLKTQAGFRCAVDLRKYPAFFSDVWDLAAKPAQDMRLAIGRRRYLAQVSPILKNLVEQFAQQLTDEGFDEVRKTVVRSALARRQEGAANAEAYVNSVIQSLADTTAQHVTRPLLTLLEEPFKQAAYSAEDSIFEIESDLTEALCGPVVEHVVEPLNSLLLTGQTQSLSSVMEEFFSAEALRSQVVEFFESFAAADAFQEIRDVLNYMHSEDTLTTYLYFGAMKFGQNDYPLFYIPVTLRAQEEGGYELVADPRLYIHKQAIEYTISEMRQQAEQVKMAVIAERIIHLADGPSASECMERTMRDLGRSLDAAAQIDLCTPRPQKVATPQVRMSNAVYLAVFDRSDESLVNDYEALLSSLDADHQAASNMFQGLVKAVLFENPGSVSSDVRAEWDALSPAQRLVTNSPIPLNEEQIRIDSARRRPGCQFIAVEGPPGTGKSHTITALAFNSIMEHKSVLIVSDKNEALEVVQDKLTQALQSVRHGDEFPNPILRLGKDGTYRSLISGSSRVKIQNHHQAQKANMPSLERELAEKTTQLATQITNAVDAMTTVDMKEIARFHELEATLEGQEGLVDALTQIVRQKPAEVRRLWERFSQWSEADRKRTCTDHAGARSLSELIEQLRVQALAAAVVTFISGADRRAMILFEPLAADQAQKILEYVAKIKALRMPLFGYFFRSAALSALDAQIASDLPCRAPVGISKKSADLERVASVLSRIRATAQNLSVPQDSTAKAYSMLQRSSDSLAPGDMAAASVLVQLKTLLDGSAALEFLEGAHHPSHPSHSSERGVLQTALDLVAFMGLHERISSRFREVPQVRFVSDKSRLETLNTARLAHLLDSRFLDFSENNRATATALGGVIRQRAQFPTDQFATLRDAFPCVIAGIRELGEFVPLKTQIFDVVIIDEGSQVSVAQAMPAMLRAKQVIVFGDRRQFSNVKSHNASNATNASFMSDLKDYFRTNVTSAVDKLERLQRFDVKRSVLEFVELVANHTEMLRKHFRGYPELISYSSRNFYDGALQAIKVRPVPIDQVLSFDVLSHDGRMELKRNTNQMEADRVIEVLEELLETENPPSVGIITPHTEQAAFISSMIVRHAKGQQFEQRLRLKVMTFDTCQGEERDLIIYSMVATRSRDVLNYIFPVTLSRNEDENDNMKAQRLNVGFSRAKESMLFLLSKPPEEFKGSIGQALMHYKQILEDRCLAEEQDTDASSPMEKKLLHWLKQTAFMQQQAGCVELIAQFPVGDYLKQLDASYKHPSYRADFLIRHFAHEGASGNGKIVNVIVEYDGFEYHFKDRSKVSAANYEWYYRPEDVERQFVLESYGYRFLRVNRFNLGEDPVTTLDQRLRELIPVSSGEGAQGATSTGANASNSVVQKIKEQAMALDSKEAKTCSKCSQVKDQQEFFDKNLKGGTGGYGRICMTCKGRSVSRHGHHPGWAGYRR